jgi:hypothetical protein
MPARTTGGILVVAAALVLAAGAGSAQAAATTSPAVCVIAPDAMFLPGAPGGLFILSSAVGVWRVWAWTSGMCGASPDADLQLTAEPTSSSAAEAPALLPSHPAPPSYGGGRGDDPAGPWPKR